MISMGLVGGALLLGPVVAAAAAPATGHSNALFVAQFIALLLVGRLLGELMQRIGQPVVMGQLLAGILLGPSVLGALFPHAQQALFPASADQRSMIDAVGQLGVLMLLLLTGMETDLSVVAKIRRPAITVSFFGIAIPFTLGFFLGELLPDALLPDPGGRLITSLFCGVALSISSVKIVAMVVREMNFTHRRVGEVLLAASIVDDTVGWIILAAVLGLAQRGRVDARTIVQILLATLVFLGLSFTIGQRLVSFLIRIVNDRLKSELAVISAILIIMGLFALVTNAMGVHTVLGAFVAGMLVGRSPILTRHIDEQLRGLIVALFMPVFFGLAGLTADLSILKQPALLGWAAAFILAASIGKFSGSYIGGRLGALGNRESLALGCGMNARGSTEVIVATLGLSIGALNTTLFTLIVTMALVTTLAMPPMLRWSLARVPISREETERLERMAFEGRGYVPQLERLLAAVDQSPSGTLAARFVGLLAGAWGMPTTLVPLAQKGDVVPDGQRPEAAAVEAAMAVAVLPNEDAGRQSGLVQTESATRADDTQATIAAVSKRGFGILWIGAEPGADASGLIQPNVVDVASGFDGHVALVFARGELARNPLASELRILVPVSGAKYSRRAAEVALALAQACHAAVTGLYVSEAPPRWLWRKNLKLTLALRGGEDAILKEMSDLANQYGAQFRPLARHGSDPAEVVVQELERGHYNLVVLGVTQRPGETLAVGTTARVVLARSAQSVLLHAS
jgi:Kef-type K+ transport system membrane component KefB/nucleotide-binding universal stress UspA family protein